jgi:1,4-dihydroxy-2-naphthoyl-CoA hydrolase
MTIKDINSLCKNTFIGYLGIEFTDFGDDFVEAKMPVNSHMHQPMGSLHGGVSLSLAETVASGGSFLSVDANKFTVLGLSVTGNHIATMSEGILNARADLVHKGSSTHVWDVKISAQDGKLISVARVTNIIIEKNK